MSVSLNDIQDACSSTAVSHSTLLRIKRDINEIVVLPPPGIFGLPDENNLKFLNILIIGPCDTPYRGGMFRFCIKLKDDYPIKPPEVKCLTTYEHRVRMAPEILATGFVCLGILEYKSWSPSITIGGVAKSIQSLMKPNPYGEWKESNAKESASYSKLILHETIRIAVCDTYEKKHLYPKYFAAKIARIFNQNYDYYVKACVENKQYDGMQLKDPYSSRKVALGFGNLLKKLEAIRSTIKF